MESKVHVVFPFFSPSLKKFSYAENTNNSLHAIAARN